LVLWHGEDLTPGDPTGPMTSSVRVMPLSQVVEVGSRRRLEREQVGPPRVEAVEVYILLGSLDDSAPDPDDAAGPPVRQDQLRFVKTAHSGGAGQIARLEEFARTVGALIGRSI
jgi:hypothetical protein